jgi:hypothetical protein
MRLWVSLESPSVTVIAGATGHPGTETLRLVVDVSPLVMAIWSLSAVWDIPDMLPCGAGSATSLLHCAGYRVSS